MRSSVTLLGVSVVLLAAVACNSSPTEPAPSVTPTGRLVLVVSEPCSYPGTTTLGLSGIGTVGTILTPGTTTLEIPTGRYTEYVLCRAGTCAVFGSSAVLFEIRAGETTTIPGFSGACIRPR